MSNYGILIRQVLGEQASSQAIDSDDIARRVFNLMDDEERHDTLVILLSQQVKYEVANRRRNAIDSLNGVRDEDDSPTTERKPVSRRQANVRSYWRELMREKATNAKGVIVTIGSMGVEDLEHNIKVREDLAQKNIARADQFRRLAALLVKYGVDTCDELPEQSAL